MEAQSASKYYVHRKPLLMLGFDWAARIAKHGVIARRYKEAPAAALVAQARQEFELLIPQLPFIGGRRNPLTPILIASAMFLALYKPLKARGAPAEEIGDVVYGAVEGFYRSLPRSLLRFYGGLQFRAGSRRKAREWAAESQRRQYAGDWVYQVVEEGEYDWGVDYVECGIWKFFGQQGAEEFVPYLCRLDFLASEWFDWGLVRTTTITEGGERCDFRFKRRRGPHDSGGLAEG
jgi:hypothetical protein